MLLHVRRLFQNAGLTNNAILSRKQMKFDTVIACIVWSNIFFSHNTIRKLSEIVDDPSVQVQTLQVQFIDALHQN